MERDFDTFDPKEALVDEARNRYYPAGWQKGDPVYVLNEADPLVMDEDGNVDTYWASVVAEDELYELEQRKGLDCE
jgi:hypothetical protein